MRMRIAIIVALALTLGGCAGLDFNRSLLSGGASLTATIDNPVTLDQQAAVESSYGVLATAAVNYMRLPRCRAGQVESLTNLCSRWSVVQQLQRTNRIAYGAVRNLRTFMANNQTISAISAFNAAVVALRDMRAIASINGIKTEGT